MVKKLVKNFRAAFFMMKKMNKKYDNSIISIMFHGSKIEVY